VSAGQTLVSINSDLKAKKAQADANSSGNRGIQQCQERLRSFCDFKQQSASQKELDDMTARYEMTKRDLKETKQMK
jgi:hypothetical protein